MTEAVLGTFSEVKILKTRSVLQIIVEIPIEQADEALKALGGIPQPSEERWVGIARAPKERRGAELYQPEAPTVTLTKSKEHRPFNSLPLSQQAGIRCSDAKFSDFMIETHLPFMAMGVTEAVRVVCGIVSRSELDTNDIAAAKWRKLEADYQAYLTDLMFAGSIK